MDIDKLLTPEKLFHLVADDKDGNVESFGWVKFTSIDISIDDYWSQDVTIRLTRTPPGSAHESDPAHVASR